MIMDLADSLLSQQTWLLSFTTKFNQLITTESNRNHETRNLQATRQQPPTGRHRR